jgi:hypothetical protein
MTRTTLRVAAASLAVVLALTAIAMAAPKTGRWSSNLGKTRTSGVGGGTFRVTKAPAIRPAKLFDSIVVPSDFDCNTAAIELVKKRIPIKDGRFSYTGAAYVNAEKPRYKGQLTWKGRFTSRRKVKGTIRFVSPVTPARGGRYQKKECDTGTQRWIATPGT